MVNEIIKECFMENAGFDKIICSKNIQFSTDCIASGVNNNVMVIGGSGTGKTRCVVEPNLQAMNYSNCIVTMTKPRLINKYRREFEKKGYQTAVLDFSNPMNSTVKWDPIHFCKSWKDISHICETIVYANPRKQSLNSTADPYWDIASQNLLEALFAVELHTKKKPSITGVLEMFQGLEIKNSEDDLLETNLDYFFNVVKKANQEKEGSNYCYSHWQTFRSSPLKTASSIMTSLSAALCEVFADEMLDLFRSNLPDLSYEDFSDKSKKFILFVNTSPVNRGEALLTNIFYAQTFEELFRIATEKANGKLAVPCILICDDAALGSIRGLPEYSAVIRELNISVLLNFQSESQLVELYGFEGAKTVLNNCDTTIYLGGQDIESCKSISDRVGLSVSEVLWMPIGQVYIFRRGEKGPIIAERLDPCIDE